MEHEAAKLQHASEALIKLVRHIEDDHLSLAAVCLALVEAKKVRRASTVLTKELAAMRDELQPKEAQAQNERRS